MSLTRVIGRPVYAFFHAVSQLHKVPFAAGDDAIANAVGSTFKIAAETCFKDQPIGKSLQQGASILQNVRDVISKVISVPKSWDELAKAMQKMPVTTEALGLALRHSKVACLKALAVTTGALGKTIGAIDYTSKWFNNSILIDLPQLAPLAAKLGEYRVFDMLGSAGATGMHLFSAMGCKRIKNPLAYVTGTVRIITNLADLYKQVREEATDKKLEPHEPVETFNEFTKLGVTEEKTNDQRYYKYRLCFFKCTTELVKMYFTYVGGGAKGNIPRAVGFLGAIIQNSDMLFGIYKLQKTKVDYPKWLK